MARVKLNQNRGKRQVALPGMPLKSAETEMDQMVDYMAADVARQHCLHDPEMQARMSQTKARVASAMRQALWE